MVGLCLVCGLALSAAPAQWVQRPYHGWSDALCIDNGSAEVVVVPSLGRIMRFAPSGGENFLWENPACLGRTRPDGDPNWFNAGGDKVWPAEQSAWPAVIGRGWPPDRVLDGAPWTAEVLPGPQLRLTSGISSDYELRAERTLTLAADRASLLIEQRFTKLAGPPAKVTIWNVSQTDDPERAWLPTGPVTTLPRGYHDFERPDLGNMERVGDHLLEIRRLPDASTKFGTDSDRGWVAALRHGVVFSQHYQRTPGDYPDHGCVAEAYTEMDAIAKMVELELLSPQATLSVGESLTWTIEWRLTAAPNGLDREQMRSWLGAQMTPLGWPYERHTTVNRRGTLY